MAEPYRRGRRSARGVFRGNIGRRGANTENAAERDPVPVIRRPRGRPRGRGLGRADPTNQLDNSAPGVESEQSRRRPGRPRGSRRGGRPRGEGEGRNDRERNRDRMRRVRDGEEEMEIDENGSHHPPPLYEYSEKMVNAGFAFDQAMGSIKFKSCSRMECGRTAIDLPLKAGGICTPCSNPTTRKLFAPDNIIDPETMIMMTNQTNPKNTLDPGPIPPELTGLSFMEQVLIARICPIMRVYKLPGRFIPTTAAGQGPGDGQYRFKGNVISFRQDVNSFATILPLIPEEIPVLIFAKETPGGLAKFRVRRPIVEAALRCLKRIHHYYHDVTIDEVRLSQLPMNGDMAHKLRTGIVDDTQQEFNLAVAESFVPQFQPEDHNQLLHKAFKLPYPGTEGDPINEYDQEGFFACAFPHLFPTGKGDFKYPRDDEPTFDQYVTWLLQYRDQRFVKDVRFLFFLMNFKMRRETLSTLGVYFNRTRVAPLNVREVRERIETDPGFLQQVMVHAAKTRSSAPYWRLLGQELLDMINQIGCPTFFFTISFADHHWPDLYRLLVPEGDDPWILTDEERYQLMIKNPHITTSFFEKRVRHYVRTVLIPIFGVVDYWYRFEWQWRGSAHVHGFIYTPNAPDIEKEELDPQEFPEWCGYYDCYCTVWNLNKGAPVPNVHPCRIRFTDVPEERRTADYIECANKFLRHTKHTASCLRKSKNSSRGGRNGAEQPANQDQQPMDVDNIENEIRPPPAGHECRFHFPFELHEHSQLNVKDGHLEFIPKRNDPLMGRHNPFIVSTWRANIDFSPITDKYGLMMYLSKYVTKGEPASKSYLGLFKECVLGREDDCPARKALGSALIQTNGRDYGLPEAMHLVAGLPLYHCSRQFVTICLYDNEWARTRVTGDELQEAKNILQKYRERPEDMADMCLLDFAKKVEAKKVRGQYQYNLRAKWAIARVMPKLKVTGNAEEDEKYYRQRVILESSFRTQNYDELLYDRWSGDPCETWRECFESMRLSVEEPINLPGLTEDDEGEPIERINEVDQIEPFVVAGDMLNDPQDAPLGTRQMDRAFDWPGASVNNRPYSEVKEFLRSYRSSGPTRPSTSSEQPTIFNLSAEQQEVMAICEQQIQWLHQNDRRIRVPPKRIAIQGKAGCGKSFLIRAIVKKVREEFGADSIQVVAPSGSAAINVEGRTIHSFFKLGFSSHYEPLNGERQRDYQRDMGPLKFVIIDEMSLVGASLLYRIERRCQEAHPNVKEPFGGIVVYMLGDFRQLPPVRDIPLYAEKVPNTDTGTGIEIFAQFDAFLELKQCHRQRGPGSEEFIALLDNVARGACTDDDYKLLMSRRFLALSPTDREKFKDAIRLYPTHAAADNANDQFLKNTKLPVARIVSHNEPDCRSDNEKDQILPHELKLAIGCRVMLRTNLWVENGLVNGSTGTLRAIYYAPDTRPPLLPKYVLVEFDDYHGPFFPSGSRFFPIEPITKSVISGGTTYSRTQLPLMVAHAVTIHRSQGLTIPWVVINLGNSEMSAGLTYVALSRVKQFSDIMFETQFPKRRLDKIGQGRGFQRRLNFIDNFGRRNFVQ